MDSFQRIKLLGNYREKQRILTSGRAVGLGLYIAMDCITKYAKQPVH